MIVHKLDHPMNQKDLPGYPERSFMILMDENVSVRKYTDVFPDTFILLLPVFFPRYTP